MKKIFFIPLLTLALASCGAQTAQNSERPQVYASFYAMYDFARTVCGDNADVYDLVPVGSEPHDFEPTAADIAKISKADMFVYHGAGMDDWVNDIITTLPDSVKVVCAAENVTVNDGDPHTWLSFENAQKELEAIYKGISECDSESGGIYLDNLLSYCGRLDTLEGEYEAAGLSGKRLFAAHGAYGYLCRDYGMEQTALEGIWGDSDPSPAQMASVVDEIKSEGAKYIYYDPLEGGKTAQAAASEAGIEAIELYTFEGDTEDRDFITIMEYNLQQLKR